MVVADLSEARIYSANADLSTLKLLATVRNPAARTPERNLLTGRGGSKYNRAGGLYQALAPPSRVHRERSEQFAKAVAAIAGRDCASTEQLALVASPRLLGSIRLALPGGVRARLRSTVARDVTHESAARLRVRLQRELGSAPEARQSQRR
ncbi:MAG: host attachment protein [Proteobacteria bacterium]|nr:host attachment protein [Pseudomonadota bacterium]